MRFTAFDVELCFRLFINRDPAWIATTAPDEARPALAGAAGGIG